MIINIKIDITNEEEIKKIIGNKKITDMESKREIKEEYLNKMRIPFNESSNVEIEIANTVWVIGTSRGWISDNGFDTEEYQNLMEFDTEEEVFNWLRENDYPEDKKLFSPIEIEVDAWGEYVN